jgi:hypothetical protein
MIVVRVSVEQEHSGDGAVTCVGREAKTLFLPLLPPFVPTSAPLTILPAGCALRRAIAGASS